MTTPDLSSVLKPIFHGLKLTRDGNYSSAAATTVILYDICTTFSDEVQLIWRKKWTLPKVLYLLARYYGLFFLAITLSVGTNTNLSLKFCKGYFYYINYGGSIFFTTVVNAIFVIRIHALYGKNRWVLALFISLCIAEFVFEFITTYKSAAKSAESVTADPLGIPWPGCIATAFDTKWTLFAWVPCLIVSIVFFSFTIYKFAVALRRQPVAPRFGFQEKVDALSPMLLVFVRDGSFYFFLIFAILLVCTIFIVPIHGEISLSLIPWIIAVYSLAGSHLVLDLRKAGRSNMESLPATYGTPLAFIVNSERRNSHRSDNEATTHSASAESR